MKFRLTLFCAVFLLGCLPLSVRAATIYLTPSRIELTPGDSQVVRVVLDSQGENINVVSLDLGFPSELIEIVRVDRGSSFLTLWAEEPVIDPATGRLTLAGGVPNGSVVAGAPIVDLVLRASSVGSSFISPVAATSAVYRNDGSGQTTSLAVQPAAVTVSQPDPFRPVLQSPSHPDESRWSANQTFTVTWDVRPDALYSYSLSRDASEAPDDLPEAVVGRVDHPSLVDGQWFFALKERLSGEAWSPVVRRRVMIDSTPPEPFTIEPITGQLTETTLLSFQTTDATSGVDYYELNLRQPRSSWFPFGTSNQWQRVTNPYSLSDTIVTGSISIRAIDGAGNEQIATLASHSLRQAQLMFYGAVVAIVLAVILLVILRRRHQ